MGGSTWSDDAYKHIQKTMVKVNTDEIFVNNKTGNASKSMQAQNIKVRESRDSEAHPESLSIAIFLDVTGSMGKIPEILIREKLGTLMNTLIKNGLEHPQIMFGAIGDHISDKYPLQVGQFESGTKELVHDLSSFLIEGGGGSNNQESYLLAWLFCSRQTSCDCFEKRGKKGYLFTIGDEKSWDNLSTQNISKITGKESNQATDKELLQEVMRSYNVYHLHINEGSYKNDRNVFGYWKILGNNFIVVEDYREVATIIAQTILKNENILSTGEYLGNVKPDDKYPANRYAADEQLAESGYQLYLSKTSTDVSEDVTSQKWKMFSIILGICLFLYYCSRHN